MSFAVNTEELPSLVRKLLNAPGFRMVVSEDNIYYTKKLFGEYLLLPFPENMLSLSLMIAGEFSFAALSTLNQKLQDQFNAEPRVAKQMIDCAKEYYKRGIDKTVYGISSEILYNAYLNLQVIVDLFSEKSSPLNVSNIYTSPDVEHVCNALTLADRKFFCPHQEPIEEIHALKTKFVKEFNAQRIHDDDVARTLAELLKRHIYSMDPHKSLNGQTVTAAPINFTYNLLLKLTNPTAVYEIGTGPGCQLANTAVLLPEARIVSVECHKELAELAKQNLGKMYNETGTQMSQHIEIVTGDGFDFQKNLQFFDGEKPEFMYLCASINENDPRLSEALRHVRPGGFLLAPVDTGLYLPDGGQVHLLRLYQRGSEDATAKEAQFVDLQSVNFGFII